MGRKSRILFQAILLGTTALTSGCAGLREARTPSSNADVPEAYKVLYDELEGQLASAETIARALPNDKPCPAMAPSLFLAGSFYGATEVGSSRWAQLLTALDGFQRVGATAVSVMISFPNLTPNLRDPEPLLQFYRALANEIHRRKMKLLVEHFIVPPSAATADGKFVAMVKSAPHPPKAFFAWKAKEIELILTRIQPDYLTVLTEPETHARFLGFPISPETYARWLTRLLSRLHSRIGRTKIGAGAGAWEQERFLDSLAPIAALDYVDFHFYPMKLGATEYFPKLLSQIDRLQARAPGKEIVVSETWLYKHGAAEANGVFNTESYARNAHSFWAPLDARFFALWQRIAQAKGISVIAPYFPQFFYSGAQLAAGSPLPPWPASLNGEWNRALVSVTEGAVSNTGWSFRELVRSCGGPKTP